MKTLAAFELAILTLAAAAVRVQAINQNWNADADPCSALQKRACQDDDLCVFTLAPSNHPAVGKNDQKNYGRHSGPEGKGGNCAARHIHDRANKMSTNDQADMLAKHGLNSDWDKIACEEAFFLKDCKDVSQYGDQQNDGIACDWTCGGGCVPAGDQGSQYENCAPSLGCNEDGFCLPPVAIASDGDCEALGYGRIESADECMAALNSYGHFIMDGGNDEFGLKDPFEDIDPEKGLFGLDSETSSFGCSFMTSNPGVYEDDLIALHQRSYHVSTNGFFNENPDGVGICFSGTPTYCMCTDPRKA